MVDKTMFWELMVFTTLVVASYIDSFHVYPKQINATKASNVQCQDNPDECWIQIKKRAA